MSCDRLLGHTADAITKVLKAFFADGSGRAPKVGG
jgi:hypothetical protein